MIINISDSTNYSNIDINNINNQTNNNNNIGNNNSHSNK